MGKYSGVLALALSVVLLSCEEVSPSKPDNTVICKQWTANMELLNATAKGRGFFNDAIYLEYVTDYNSMLTTLYDYECDLSDVPPLLKRDEA